MLDERDGEGRVGIDFDDERTLPVGPAQFDVRLFPRWSKNGHGKCLARNPSGAVFRGLFKRIRNTSSAGMDSRADLTGTTAAAVTECGCPQTGPGEGDAVPGAG